MQNYIKELKQEVGSKEFDPLDRLEPGTVMVDFIRYLTGGKDRVTASLYLTCKENEGDNSDNGHHDIILKK